MAIRKTGLFCSMTIFLLLALGALPAWGADATPPSAAGDSLSTTGRDEPTYNDYARFLAGLSNPQGPLAACERDPAWAKYAAFINRSWEVFDQRRLAPMREWAAGELAAATAPTVFYPFSGPDFVNVHTLFPRAKTYLLVALEPVGDLPDLADLDAGNFFASLERTLYDLLHLDFFITKKMAASLGKTELKGVLPVLLLFLAREQARVLDVRYWRLKPDGTVSEAPALGGEPEPEGIPGVRLVFKGPGASETQTLYYFRFNLQNKSFQENRQFVSFLESFGALTTFTKAASYLMFSPNSAEVRKFVLDRSLYVLQGDSGIPLQYFDPTVWNLKFYGTYTGPIPLFKNRFQKDLAERYRQGRDVYPLPFGIGYRHRLNTSNLMFAAKKAIIFTRGSP